MKTKNILIALLAATLALTACTEKSDPTPDPAGMERTIVYSVDTDESRRTLGSDAEWDALLDRFCAYAEDGHSVTFFNTTPKISATKGLTKDAVTFSTTDREAMKDWMKQMERDGKTVNVTYNNGTWNGTAYTNIVPQLQENDNCRTGVLIAADMPSFDLPTLPGLLWALKVNDDSILYIIQDGFLIDCNEEHLDIDGAYYNLGDTLTLCGKVETAYDINGQAMLTIDLTPAEAVPIAGSWTYAGTEIATVTHSGNGVVSIEYAFHTPEDYGYTLTLDLHDDGTATMTRSDIATGAVSTESSTWSLSDNGDICCDLFAAGGGCWTINWLSPASMIVSRVNQGSEEGNIYSQMHFVREQ